MGLTCIEVICMRWMPDEIPNKSVVFGFLNLPFVLLIVRKKNTLLTKHEIVLLFVIEKQFANLVLCVFIKEIQRTRNCCVWNLDVLYQKRVRVFHEGFQIPRN